ncbi:cytochrome P450 [Pseudonocardia sp. CA-142604]|uniref:cytochrome P450 n=1 Tax=Pseudonocardia sp. CA-142604 TaxID=3240024 RepID=UPI003D913987
MSSPADLDKNNVVDVDLGSDEFKANAHRYMGEWAQRPPFYVPAHGRAQVVVSRYADVLQVFSDTATFASEMPRGPGWEQFNKIMDAQFITQMDGEQHARVRRLLIPAFSSRRIEQLRESITRIVDGLLGWRRWWAWTRGARRSSSPFTTSYPPPRTSNRANRGPTNCDVLSIEPWTRSRSLSTSDA